LKRGKASARSPVCEIARGEAGGKRQEKSNFERHEKVKKILIIDDDKDFSQMMKRNLEFTGRYETLLAAGSKEGLTLASRYRPDLILLDMVMPGMGGLEILKMLKKKRETQSIPVIIISGKEPDSYITEVIGGYAEHIFSKPVGLLDLNSRIEELFHFIPLQARPG
jgi:PleD family two-component response regulator